MSADPLGRTVIESFTTSRDGQIVANLHVTGDLTVNHEDVLFRNCVIDGDIHYTADGATFVRCAFTRRQ